MCTLQAVFIQPPPWSNATLSNHLHETSSSEISSPSSHRILIYLHYLASAPLQASLNPIRLAMSSIITR